LQCGLVVVSGAGLDALELEFVCLSLVLERLLGVPQVELRCPGFVSRIGSLVLRLDAELGSARRAGEVLILPCVREVYQTASTMKYSPSG
jgi:hypothetical protein